MSSKTYRSCAQLATALLAVGAAACADPTRTGGTTDTDLVASAFISVPPGFDATGSSFAGGPDGGMGPWMADGPAAMMGGPGMGGAGMGGPGMGPGGRGGPGGPGGPGGRGGPGGPGGRGGRGGPGGPHDGPGGRGGGPGGLMGGGLAFDHFGTLHGTCTFQAASGRVVCDPIDHDGLTILQSASYKDGNGAVQQARDSLTTNTVNVQVSVSGTMSHHGGEVTTTVAHTSDRTVTGLAAGSTQRTVNGAAGGTEHTAGTRNGESFTADRTVGDTTRNLVIPVPATPGAPTYPTAGTIIRGMQATLTHGTDTKTMKRREEITFDGSATAKLVITVDGTTKRCTLPLPKGRPTCS